MRATMLVRTWLLFAVGAGLLGVTPAIASTIITYSTRTDYTVTNIVTANFIDGQGLTFETTQASLTAPSGSFVDPHPWDPAPYAVFLMGEREDASGNAHLVLGVNPLFARQLIGQSFASIFPRMNELLVLGAIDLLSSNVPYDPAIQIIVDFSQMVGGNGGQFDPDGGAFMLVSFSDGQAIGTGTASIADPDAPPPPPPSAVPEPASWLMMLAGFGLLGALLRRRPALAALG